jgi:4-hydroxyphenylpyruvate dioxygenase
MKFAAAAHLPPPALASIAKSAGFDGIKIRAEDFPPSGSPLHIAIAAVSAALSIPQAKAGVSAERQRVERIIDLTATAGATLLTLSTELRRGADTDRLADALLALADRAAEKDVTLALDLPRVWQSAREAWSLLERLNHPSLGCVLDLWACAAAGETPQVVIPMLNSKIVCVRVADGMDVRDPATACAMGQGVIPVRTALARLRGIGYQGWVILPALGAASLPAETYLPAALATVASWNAPAAVGKAKARK